MTTDPIGGILTTSWIINHSYQTPYQPTSPLDEKPSGLVDGASLEKVDDLIMRETAHRLVVNLEQQIPLLQPAASLLVDQLLYLSGVGKTLELEREGGKEKFMLERSHLNGHT